MKDKDSHGKPAPDHASHAQGGADHHAQNAKPHEEEGLAKDTHAAELVSAKEQLLRALAEVENVRRRGQKEREDASRYAVSGFAKDMLDVADNLRRALDAMARINGGESMASVIGGVEATERQLLAAFERHGIKKINPVGQPFDPNFHRAMMEVEDSTHTPGTVVQVLQPGYVIHDRLLREALVAVSKAAPEAQKVDATV
ncbi:MAG: nucleotide exchange factor GrpE [Bdellovibrionales bacterium]